MSGGDWKEFSSAQNRRTEGLANEDDEFGDFEGFEDVEQLGLNVAQPLPEALQATWASFPDYVPSQTASNQARHPDLLPRQAALHTSLLTDSSSSVSDFDFAERCQHGSNEHGEVIFHELLPDISSPDRIPPDLAVADVQRVISNPLPDVSPQGGSHLELVGSKAIGDSPPQFHRLLPDVSPSSSSNQPTHHSLLPDISPSSNSHLSSNFPDVSPPSHDESNATDFLDLKKYNPLIADYVVNVRDKFHLIEEKEEDPVLEHTNSGSSPLCSNVCLPYGSTDGDTTALRPLDSLGARQKTVSVATSIESSYIPLDVRQNCTDLALVQQQMNELIDQNRKMFIETESLRSQLSTALQCLRETTAVINAQEVRLQKSLESNINVLHTSLTKVQDESIQQKLKEQESALSELKESQNQLKESVLESINNLKVENEANMTAQLTVLRNTMKEDLQGLLQNVATDGVLKQACHNEDNSIEKTITDFKSYMQEQRDKEQQARFSMLTILDTLLSSTKEQLLNFQDPEKKS